MSFHGLQLQLRDFSGAAACRVVHPSRQRIEEHQHELVCLDLYVLGSYSELQNERQVWIGGPSVVLHPSREPHANCIDEGGMEAIGIQLDLDWLRCAGFDRGLDGPRCWIGGKVAAAACGLAAVWSNQKHSERDVAKATVRFLSFALESGADARPDWLDDVSHALEIESPPRTTDLARSLDLHPAWLARAYRASVGEGIQETLRRKKVERAVALLRGSDHSVACIAADAGFCDQSHMNRVFRTILGRTPLQVRAERQYLRAFNTAHAV